MNRKQRDYRCLWSTLAKGEQYSLQNFCQYRTFPSSSSDENWTWNFAVAGLVLSTVYVEKEKFAVEIRQFFLRWRAFDVTGQETRCPRQEMLGSSPLNGIIHVNIIWRAFTVHLMFHERAEWMLHVRAIAMCAWTKFSGSNADTKKQGRLPVTLIDLNYCVTASSAVLCCLWLYGITIKQLISGRAFLYTSARVCCVNPRENTGLVE